MSVHSSLRRRAIAVPVALVVALGASGFIAAPAYAASADTPGEEVTPVAVTVDPEVVDDETPAPDAEGEAGSEAPPAAPTDDTAPESETLPTPDAGEAPASEPDAEPVPDAEPAPAPEAAPFAILSPAADATTLTRTVLFAGTATDGGTITLTDDQGAPLPGAAPVTTLGGAWTTTVAYPDDAPADQTVVVVLSVDGAEPQTRTVSFSIPAPGTPVPFQIVTPTAGEQLPTRTVAFTGTGEEGAVVTVTGSDGQPLPGTQPVTVVAGIWLVAAMYPDDAPVAQTATVTLSVAGQTPESLDVSFELPAVPALPAPVVTSPTAGEVVTGSQVTFRGTGQPGAFVGLLVVPTALAGAGGAGEVASDEASLSAAAAPAAAPEPVDPADPILVAEDGTWSVTVALAPEDYTVVAVQASDAAGTTGLSDPSEPVAFTLRAAAVVTPALASNGSGGGGRTLAATGGEDVTGLFGLSVLVMIAGAAAVVATGRRRATR